MAEPRYGKEKYDPNFCYFKQIFEKTRMRSLYILKDCDVCRGYGDVNMENPCPCYLKLSQLEKFALEDIAKRKKFIDDEDKKRDKDNN